MKPQLLFALSCLFILFGCSETDNDESAATSETITMSQLSGEVFYLQRKMLPPGSVLTVSLEDVSKMDVASTKIAEVKQEIAGGPPYAFTLEYNAGLIKEKMRYSLRAKITLEGALLMTSTEAFNPFTADQDNIEIKLSMVERGAATESKTSTNGHKADTGLAVVSVNPLADLTNTYWKLISIEGQPVTMEAGQQREAFFQLQENELRLKGFAGCNQLMGNYSTHGNELSFSGLAATRKACSVGMQTEGEFIQALNAARHFSINEHALTLLDAAKKPIARFEAQYFN